MVFRMDRKHAALLQVGIAIVTMILFIGVLNSVVYSHRVPLVTTESLWKHAGDVYVSFGFVNTATGAERHVFRLNLSSVATYFNGYLYINIPYQPNEVLTMFSIFSLRTVDGRLLTLNALVESGANYVYLYLEPINTTAVSFNPTYHASEPRIYLDSGADQRVTPWSPDRLLASLAPPPVGTPPNAPAAEKWGKMFPDKGRFNRTVQLDLGSMLLSGMGLGNNFVGIALQAGHASPALAGLKLRLEIYGVSEKPVLRALTEPIYSFFAALYATLLAVIKRVKQFAASAFGGFVSSFTLTGLIGDPVTALILTMVFVTVVFLVIKKK